MTKRIMIMILLVVGFLAGTGTVSGQIGSPSGGNAPSGGSLPFHPGEHLEYAVSYGAIPAGTMVFHIEDLETLAGRPAYHFVSSAESNKAVSFLYELDQSEEAWFDVEELYSLKYSRRSIENDKTRDHEVVFDQQRQLRIAPDGDTDPASPRAVDQLSMIYFLRLLPFEAGARFMLRNQADPNDNPIGIRVLKTERIKVPAGTFEVYVLQLNLTTDRGVFKRGGDNRAWVTTDAQHVPVKLSSRIGLGNFQAELVEYVAGKPGAVAR